jgi:hypothetical protein
LHDIRHPIRSRDDRYASLRPLGRLRGDLTRFGIIRFQKKGGHHKWPPFLFLLMRAEAKETCYGSNVVHVCPENCDVTVAE